MIDSNTIVSEKNGLQARRKSLFWRIHFWAALIASPFTLIAAMTGILYLFTPQIEAVLYDKLDHVTPAGAMRPLDDAVAAARAAAPAGMVLHSVLPAHGAGDTVQLTFAPGSESGHEGHQGHGARKVETVKTGAAAAPKQPSFGLPAQSVTLHVNPYSADVVGTLANEDRFNQWAKKLHSRILQGDGWRWMIELAASWLMVMLITGIWLWWPQGLHKALPQGNAKGRTAWKQWHAFLGVALSVVSLAIVTTGLTWSKQAGGQIRVLRDLAGQASPRVPGNLTSIRQGGASMLNWQAALDVARLSAPDVALQLTAPKGEQGVWRVASADRSQPWKKFDLIFDAYSGQRLHYANWDDDTAFGKATAVGIPFHRGELGWWNQALLLVFGLGVLFSLMSGWVMFFKRRRAGARSLPHLLPGAWTSASIASSMVAAALCIALPLLALSASIVLIIELLLHHTPWRTRSVT